MLNFQNLKTKNNMVTKWGRSSLKLDFVFEIQLKISTILLGEAKNLPKNCDETCINFRNWKWKTK